MKVTVQARISTFRFQLYFPVQAGITLVSELARGLERKRDWFLSLRVFSLCVGRGLACFSQQGSGNGATSGDSQKNLVFRSPCSLSKYKRYASALYKTDFWTTA